MIRKGLHHSGNRPEPFFVVPNVSVYVFVFFGFAFSIDVTLRFTYFV